MITDKYGFHRSGFALLLALILLFCPLLSSCSDDDDSGDIYGELLNGLQEELDGAELTFEKYVLVISSDCTASVYDAAKSLTEKIKENTGANASLVYDYENVRTGSDECEILIGDTSRDESYAFMRGFRANDYGYKYTDGVILVGGLNEESTLAAIEKFRKDVVAYADGELFMNVDAEYFYRGEYDVKKVTIDGFELCDYVITYDKNDLAAYEAAVELRSTLEARTGYYLRLREDSDVSDDSRAICVGKTRQISSALPELSLNEAVLISYEKGICLGVGDKALYRLTAQRLAEMLCNVGDEGICQVSASDTLKWNFLFSELTMLELNYDSSSLTVEELLSVSRMLEMNPSAVIVLRGIGESSASHICELAGNGFVMVRLSGDDKVGVYHIYSSDVFEPSIAKTNRDVVSVSYTFKATGINVSVIELISENVAGLENINELAQRVDADIAELETSVVILNSGLAADKDAVFGASLNKVKRVGEGLDMYLSDGYFTVKSAKADTDAMLEYGYISVYIYE